MSQFQLRRATPADLPVLSELYVHSVETLGPQHYSAAQVAAWADSARAPAFENFILQPRTYVAEDERKIVGFGGIAPDGHVTSLYVRGDCGRRGIGSFILNAIIADAQEHSLPRLYTEASEFSRPLFAKHGFQVVATEVVERGPVTFTRYCMKR